MDKAAIYCRLSKEDKDKIAKGDDSESIQNQKLLLMDYAVKHDMMVYKIYSDDDYSGADKDRPEWNRMLRDAKNGEFNVIICKTQSRFTREMEMVEKYIHGHFLEWGIRFIGVVDNVDTNIKGNKKSRQINGLVNEWYLEDLSENIKSVFRQKMEEGQFLGAFAPYGYMKDPNDKHKLIIDNDAAEVVRMIFDLSLQGHGVDIISQKLTALNIPTPTEYKKNKGMNFKNPNSGAYSSKGIWSTTTIKRILNNEVYIGTLIQGREKRVSYKSKKVVIAPKDEWVIIKNNHEPIISKETFEKTQELMQLRRKTCKTTAGKKFIPHLFSGRIKCADCHSTMAKTSGRLAGGYDYFICQLAKKSKLEECTRHSIRYDHLEEYIDQKIKERISKVLQCEGNVEDIKKAFKKGNIDKKKINSLKNSLDIHNQKILDIQKTLSNLYIDKVKGIITEDEFVILKTSLNDELSSLTAQTQLLKDELDKIDQKDNEVNLLVNTVNRYANYKELTFEIVNAFIKCIYVHETDEEQKQKISIDWKV